MLNPALNRKPATRLALLALCIAAVCITLPVAAIRAAEPALQQPSATPKTLAAAVEVTAPATIPETPAPVAGKVAPAPRSAVAQTPANGSLTGTIFDPTGAVVPGVTISASNLQTLEVQTTTAGETGRFAFPALPAGRYSLTAQLPGFSTFRGPSHHGTFGSTDVPVAGERQRSVR